MSYHPIRSVVAATDLSRAADAVLSEAAALARHLGAELHVVCAYPPEAEREDPVVLEALIADAHESLSAQLRRLLPPASPATSERIVFGPAARAIVERADEVGADLIVLGPHSRGTVAAQYLGTTAEGVLRTADTPCLVMRGRLHLPVRRVAVPFDFSDLAGEALELALGWASALGGPDSGAATAAAPTVCVVHVAPKAEADERRDALRDEARAAVERARDATGRPPVPESEPIVLGGDDPASTVAAFARSRDVDLIVMGAHGRSRLQRAILGSASSGLALRAPCPVLMIPGGGAAPAEARAGRAVRAAAAEPRGQPQQPPPPASSTGSR